MQALRQLNPNPDPKPRVWCAPSLSRLCASWARGLTGREAQKKQERDAAPGPGSYAGGKGAQHRRDAVERRRFGASDARW